MQQSDAKAAIRSRLVAYIAANAPPRSLAVYGPNEATQPPASKAPFLELQFPVATEEQMSLGGIGARLFRGTSTARFVLNIQMGQGLGTWDVWMDGLRGNFRAVQFGGVQTYEPSGIVDDDHNGDGAYYSMAFVVEFYADLIA